MIQNPILPGFNPDPCICRVGDDYYIATSTFEWFPGVQIHHSRDLVHWRLIGQCLTRRSQLDMRGNPNSGGIWAPCLTYADGLFWLIYTDVKSFNGIFKDTHNYLVTAPDITGPWSEPVYLNASGFDPSLLHDTDGRKWLVNQVWDHRAGRNRFGGILLQEYDARAQRLTGPITNICRGTPIGCTEGPHLYKIDGWYYLLLAEGGTSWNHAVTLLRSKTITGPYEPHPENPVVSSRDYDVAELHKAGHGALVQTQGGEWYLVHLTSRAVQPRRHCVLGRETAIQRLTWGADGWPRLSCGGHKPELRVQPPQLPAHPWPTEPTCDDFNNPQLSVHFATLRNVPEASWLSLTARPGWLRLTGRESISSLHDQSLVARRLQALGATVTTKLDFNPVTYKQMAGLALFYDTNNFFYLFVSANDAGQRELNILACHHGHHRWPISVGSPAVLPATGSVYLRFTLDTQRLQFSYSLDGQTYIPIGPPLDGLMMSDDSTGTMSFTGTMVALACQDIGGTHLTADFDFLDYVEDRTLGWM
jgi:xylan 1,4-beta-xylosidase